MKRYLVLYNSPAEAKRKWMKLTPKQRQEGMKPWMEWKKKHGKAIEDFGSPVAPGKKAGKKGGWSNVVSSLGGYSIVKAKNITEAKKMFKGHPHLSSHPKSYVQVFECGGM